MARLLSTLLLALLLAAPVAAQQPAGPDRSATGGATTLEDILARQRGERVDNAYRRNLKGGGPAPAEFAPGLGPLGGLSDADVWRDLRFNTADVTVSAGGEAARVLVQDSGMWWLDMRAGPLARYGAGLLGAVIALLAIFFVIRGRIRIEGEKTGRTVTRFTALERSAHWLMAGAFIVLALTGLLQLFGRQLLIPVLGKGVFADMAMASKWLHNYVAWAFMLGLVVVFVMWVAHNIPNRADLKWLARGGGMLSKGVHPPARKFNAGQKIIFWAVVVLGTSIAVSGLSLLFPFQLPLFAKTFAAMNDLGLPRLFGVAALPEHLAPHQEMQYAQLWHATLGFALMAVILAHIYIGTLGMEGAFAAMGSGQVEEQWAREHHSLWLDELKKTETPQAQVAVNDAGAGGGPA